MVKRLIALLVSLAILAWLWWSVDVAAIAAAARAADPFWLGLGLLAVVPLTLATSWRFRMLSRVPIRLGSATRLILSASTLNLFLPSKMGDLAKSVVLMRRYGFEGKLAVALVVLEKALDLAALLFWGVLALLWVARGEALLLLAAAGITAGLVLLMLLVSPFAIAPRMMEMLGRLLPGKAGRAASGFAGEWRSVTGWFWSGGRAARTILLSLALWAAHLAQFWLFAQALGEVPFLDNMAFATLAILAGLLPFTMAGVGTRDAAIVIFYAPWLTAGQGAVLGVLATLRYVLPALAGLPFVKDFWERREKAA